MDSNRTSAIIGLRAVCLLVFLVYGIDINVTSVTSFCALIALFSVLTIQQKILVKEDTVKNPLKGKPPDQREEDLPEHMVQEIAEKVSKFVCNYDAQHCDTLHNFQTIQDNTACIFAKRARLWGSTKYDNAKTLEHNITESLPTFLKFTLLCEHLGLDGFLFEIPGKFGQDVETFGATVLKIMKCISARDPKGKNCMEQTIDRKGWVFEFNRVTFFITTFAPCYPSEHPRSTFNTDACYLLFQPELSFAQHDLPSDTPHTNWSHPKTVRDRIRVAFKEQGQEYEIRDTVAFPMIWDIVRPLDKTQNFVTWWK